MTRPGEVSPDYEVGDILPCEYCGGLDMEENRYRCLSCGAPLMMAGAISRGAPMWRWRPIRATPKRVRRGGRVWR